MRGNARQILRIAPVVALAALTTATAVSAQDLKRPEEQLAAIYTLRIQLDIEQHHLDSSLQRHARNARAQDAAQARVGQLLLELEAMVDGRIDSDPALIESRETLLEQAEVNLVALFREARQIRVEIRSTHERIEILQDSIDRLRRALPADNEALTGSWDVTYLPSGDQGAFTLRQSGTLLAGEYVMEGGWKGSLQGTFVDGKVLLHRIDSKLGRSSDLEGKVSPDGKTVRGTWENYVLSGGSATSGSWVARKRSGLPEEP